MSYLIHFNPNHDKLGRFTFVNKYHNSDGSVTKEGQRRYQKLDSMSDQKLHKTLKKEIHKQRSDMYGWSNQWLSGVQIGDNSKKLTDERDILEKKYKNSDEYKKWNSKVKALDNKWEEGKIDSDEYDKEYDKLMSEIPKKNFNSLHWVKRGNEFADNFIQKGGKDLSIAFLKDLGYNDSKSKEYVDRLIKSGMTLGYI